MLSSFLFFSSDVTSLPQLQDALQLHSSNHSPYLTNSFVGSPYLLLLAYPISYLPNSWQHLTWCATISIFQILTAFCLGAIALYYTRHPVPLPYSLISAPYSSAFSLFFPPEVKDVFIRTQSEVHSWEDSEKISNTSQSQSQSQSLSKSDSLRPYTFSATSDIPDQISWSTSPLSTTPLSNDNDKHLDNDKEKGKRKSLLPSRRVVHIIPQAPVYTSTESSSDEMSENQNQNSHLNVVKVHTMSVFFPFPIAHLEKNSNIGPTSTSNSTSPSTSDCNDIDSDSDVSKQKTIRGFVNNPFSHTALVYTPAWLPEAIISFYLFNPYSIMSCVSLSLSSIPYLFLTLSILLATSHFSTDFFIILHMEWLTKWMTSRAFVRIARNISPVSFMLACSLDCSLLPLLTAFIPLYAAFSNEMFTVPLQSSSEVCQSNQTQPEKDQKKKRNISCGSLLGSVSPSYFISFNPAIPSRKAILLTSLKIILSTFLVLIIPLLLTNDTTFISTTFLAAFAPRQITPSVSPIWYLFIQLFPRYRSFFLACLPLPIILYGLNLNLRLSRWPLFSFWACSMLLVAFKQSTFMDHSFVFTFAIVQLPLIIHRMRRIYLFIAVYVVTTVVGCVFTYQWVDLGVGNPNTLFMQMAIANFALCLFVIEAVSSVRRLQSLPPGVGQQGLPDTKSSKVFPATMADPFYVAKPLPEKSN